MATDKTPGSGLQAVITTVFAFLILAMIAGFAEVQWRMGWDQAGLFPERPAVALTLLMFGLPIALYGYWLVGRFLRFVPAHEAAFPRFALTRFETPQLDRLWQWHSLALICVLPVIGFAWAWHEFCTDGQAWLNDGSHTQVSPWEMLESCGLMADWNQCRFGNLTAAQQPGSTENGVSFVPFWFSVVWAGGLSALVLGQVLACLVRFARRLGAEPPKRRVALGPLGR